MLIPTIGRTVLYCLKGSDVDAIKLKRYADPRFFSGNDVREGMAFPMVIVTVHGDQPDSYVNGKVMLDGTDTYWASSVKVDDNMSAAPTPGTYRWAVRS